MPGQRTLLLVGAVAAVLLTATFTALQRTALDVEIPAAHYHDHHHGTSGKTSSGVLSSGGPTEGAVATGSVEVASGAAHRPDEDEPALAEQPMKGTRDDAEAGTTTAKGTSAPPRPKTRRPGREKIDHSHAGLVPSPDGVNHAWPPEDPAAVATACHGAKPIPRCVTDEALEFVRRHVLLAIVTGREDTFRVEISQCTWLAQFPRENVYVVTDVVPQKVGTPHQWVAGKLPDQVEERDGDLFSPYVKKGYVRAVRSAGQGYSASWIVAQFRFPQALDVMAERFEKDPELRWAVLADDDTVINIDNLAKRLKKLDISTPHYLSRKGWGGAGHIYSRAAMDRVRSKLHECVDKWMVHQFRASDAMLLKCASHLKLKANLEGTMSHCPASHLREKLYDSRDLATLHAKKDMYPPVLQATWRSALYYYGAVCRSQPAAKLAVEWSACAFGSCKSAHCSKADDAARVERWATLSQNNTLRVLPFPDMDP